jgi:hypothetical protein
VLTACGVVLQVSSIKHSLVRISIFITVCVSMESGCRVSWQLERLVLAGSGGVLSSTSLVRIFMFTSTRIVWHLRWSFLL